MDKVYQVFVSSTYSDLKEERRQVSEALAKAGYIPSGMELFPAADQDQFDFIRAVIDRCDYYVLIIGGRYGSLADDNISYTEKEYEYAVLRGIPVIAMLHAEPESIPVGKTDTEPTKVEKLKGFRDRVATGRLVRSWKSVDDLCTQVVISVVREATRKPGIGWVRGDEAIDPKILQELERLRIENRQLKDASTDDIRFPTTVPGPEKLYEFVVEKKAYTDAQLRGIKNVTHAEWVHLTASVSDIFTWLSEALMQRQSEDNLRSFVGRAVAAINSLDLSQETVEYYVSQEALRELRYHLIALDLIGIDGPSFAASWLLTDKGRRFAAQQRTKGRFAGA